MTARELIAALSAPDFNLDDPVMLIIDGGSATWLRRVEQDHGGRTVDLHGGRR